MYFMLLLLAFPLTYGALPVTTVLLFQNPNFVKWYRQNPWLKAVLMASAATLLRLVIIGLLFFALTGTWGIYFLNLLVLDVMMASSIPGSTGCVEWLLGPQTNQGLYPIFWSLLVAAPINFAFWLAAFCTITARNRPVKPRIRPMAAPPRPDRWAGRG